MLRGVPRRFGESWLGGAGGEEKGQSCLMCIFKYVCLSDGGLVLAGSFAA